MLCLYKKFLFLSQDDGKKICSKYWKRVEVLTMLKYWKLFSLERCADLIELCVLHINIIVVNFHCILPRISIRRLPRKLAPRSISCIEKLSNFITLCPMNEHYHSVKWSQKNWSGKRETFPLCLRQWRHHFLLLFMISQTMGKGRKASMKTFFIFFFLHL